jgi:hypothetical protein
MKIMFVVGDLTYGRIAEQVGTELVARGHMVVTIPEKLSCGLTGLQGRISDNKIASITTHGVWKYLAEMSPDDQPDVLVLGLSSPRDGSLEAEFEKWIHDFSSIKVVLLEDVPGALVRATYPLLASLVLTTSPWRVDEITAMGVCARAVGNIAVPERMDIPENVRAYMSGLRSGSTSLAFFTTYGSDGFAEQLELFAQCLELTPGYRGLYSIHPKKRTSAEGALRRAAFRERLGNRVIEFLFDSNYVAALADCTFAGGASSLVVAAFSDKVAVACDTPGTKAYRMQETGTARLPIVEAGAATEISQACDLRSLPKATPESLAQFGRPLDAAAAAEFIIQLG